MSVVYPGSSPEEVEEGICIKIEEQIQSIEGIKTLRSTAREGSGNVVAELETGADVQKILDEIKAEVDRIDTFPEEAEEPVVMEIINRDPDHLSGDFRSRSLKNECVKIAEKSVTICWMPTRMISQRCRMVYQNMVASILKRFQIQAVGIPLLRSGI